MLEFKYLNQQWQGINQTITVKPNTNYVLEFEYKIAADVDFMTGYCFLRGLAADGTGTGDGSVNDAVLGSIYQNVGSREEWTTDRISFRTNNSDKLGIDFRVIPGVHYYIDNIRLVEVR